MLSLCELLLILIVRIKGYGLAESIDSPFLQSLIHDIRQ